MQFDLKKTLDSCIYTTFHLARDSSKASPMLADGINVRTRKPVRWINSNHESFVLSNFASQQNFMRLLRMYSVLSANSEFLEQATETTGHVLSHFQDDTGLLYWGGHCALDLMTGRRFGLDSFHELKCHYPDYDLMWDSNPAATRRFIEGFWDSHILNWGNLDMNRHGLYGKRPERTVPLWQDRFDDGPVFFVGKGLSFINTGSDLIFAAGKLYQKTKCKPALEWARRLAHRYVQTRHEKTGLGGYQFSEVDSGDRAQAQFGHEFGPNAFESKILDFVRARRKYATVTAMLLTIAHELSEEGEDFRRWSCEDLTSFARHAYDPTLNRVYAVLTDGTRLTPDDVKREGYYKRGDFVPYQPGPDFFYAYVLGYRFSRDEFLWKIIRSIAGEMLGDLGETPSQRPRLKVMDATSDPVVVLSLVELFRITQHSEYLLGAEEVAINMVRKHFHHGLFVDTPSHLNARINRLEPLALAYLCAGKQGVLEGMPPLYLGNEAFFTAPFGAKKRSSDYVEIYPLL